MALYDCFMYFDEDMLLDIRLNILNASVNRFVIAEATKTHSCLLYTSPSPRDVEESRMPSSA